MSNMGLELMTLRSRVTCSTDWASQVPLICDPFWVNFCTWCKVFYRVLHIDVQLFQSHLLKRLSHPIALIVVLKNFGCMFLGLFLVSVLFHWKLHCFDYKSFFFKRFYLLFIWQREIPVDRGRQRQRERGKQAPCRAESPMRDLIPGLWDHDLSRRQWPNPLSHPGAP